MKLNRRILSSLGSENRSSFDLDKLELRRVLAAPSSPIITEPLPGQVVSAFDVHMQVDTTRFTDADGDSFVATNWEIRDREDSNRIVWQSQNVTDPLSRGHIHFGDGDFVGTRAGQSSLLPARAYSLWTRYTDSRGEISSYGTLDFRTQAETSPVVGLGTWIAREGYVVEEVAPTGNFRLPVNIAFVPNPGSSPTSPLYYVAELYGSVKVVRRNGSVGTFATGLLDYNAAGPFSGTGEQGMAGIVADPNGDLYITGLWDNGNPPGSSLHYPRVVRLRSTDGGQTASSVTTILNMQPETQGQSHFISTITIGPDNKLYVHMGDAFDSSLGLNNNQFRGKILRLNKDGSAPSDNAFYNASNGITATDYIYANGVRNPFGGDWRDADGRLYIAEEGNGNSRLVDVRFAGQSLGYTGTDQSFRDNSIFIWDPATAPVGITFVQSGRFGGSLFPADSQDHAFVSLSGPTYATGPQDRGKYIAEFTDLTTRNSSGKLTTAPRILVKYNGTGRATIAGIAAGPDGIYFTDLYRDDGAGGPTATGARVYRVRYTDFAPQALSSINTASGVSLSWLRSDLAASYTVYRRSTSGAFVEIGSTTSTTFLDTQALSGTSLYMVRGVNAGGQSEDSNESTVNRSPGSISGVVYNDVNADGTRDAGDAGVGGRIVYIDTNRNFLRDSGERSTTTASDGSWQFTNVAPGGYLIRNEVPTGSRAISPNNSEWWHNLGTGQAVSNNFGVAPAAAPGTLSGTVYQDSNRNGIRDAVESAQSGQVVYIDSNRNNSLDSGEPSVTTGSSGTWQFSNLSAGGYLVRIQLASGQIAVNPGNSEWWHSLAAGQSLNNDFGVSVATVITPGLISGIVFDDANLNGLVDANEPRLSGRFIYLDLNRDGIDQSTEPFSWTDAQGRWQFNNVTPGGYLVRHLFDTNVWRGTSPNNNEWWHNVASGQAVANNFGVARLGVTLSSNRSKGRLFFDANVDRTRQTTERLAANVRIFYDADNDGILDKNEKVIKTNRNGAFDFGTIKVLDRKRIRLVVKR